MPASRKKTVARRTASRKIRRAKPTRKNESTRRVASRRRHQSATSAPRAERSAAIDHGRVTLARIVRLPRVRGSRKQPTSPVSGWIPMRNSSHVRWSKVMTAQARIAVGYYDRHDVKELVLDAVLKELTRH